MEKECKLRVFARGNMGTLVVVTVSVDESVTDLTPLIYTALSKVESFSNKLERFEVEHIEVSKYNIYGKSKESNFEVYP